MDEIKRHGPLEARLWVQHNSKHVITPTIISMLAENDDLRARLAALTDAIGNIERLFSGDPDTSCRTTWRRTYTTTDSDMLISRPPVECVEVPLDDLRAVLAAADRGVTDGEAT